MSGPSVFDQARRQVSVEDLVGSRVKLTGGRAKRGPCPICSAGSKSRSQPFQVSADGRHWRCWAGCDRGGDVIDLYRELVEDVPPYEAALALVGGRAAVAAAAPARAEPVAAPSGPSVSDRVALETWAEARPFLGSLAERYLLGRGIAREVVSAVSVRLRYHPFAKHSWSEEAKAWVKAPAMVGRVETRAGPTGGVHCTFLRRPPREGGPVVKDPVLAKRMWGPQLDGEGRPGGLWLIGPGGLGDLAVGEGVETTLSVVSLELMRSGRMIRAAAALSLGRLQGGLLRDSEDYLDPYDLKGDPAKPPFLWPQPDEWPWQEVMVAVDRDMSPLRLTRCRTPRGKIIDFELDSEARARLCGRLAVAAWAAAGSPARAVAPPPGSDFNDELRRVLAARSAA